MKTILVPTDYSATAKNAALYAIHLASAIKVSKIVLYNAYQTPAVVADTAVMPTAAIPFFDVEDFRSISNTSMRHFKDSIQSFCPADIEIVQQIEYAGLESDINEICEKTNAHLIVLGITAASKIEEVLIGSTAINVVKSTKTPVIIVPAEARYSSVKNVMLACDFKKVAETTPLQPIKNILDATKASLHIVNIYDNENDITSGKTYQQELLHSLFIDYNPQFRFEYNEDFVTGINNYAQANNIDLIITIPKKHAFFEGLFKERHIKKLAFHSHVPLMCIHVEDLQ